MQNAVSAFIKAEICPLNRTMFTDADFAPSRTTEILFVPSTTNVVSQDPLPREITPSPIARLSTEECLAVSDSLSLVSRKYIMPIPHYKKNMRPPLRQGKTVYFD